MTSLELRSLIRADGELRLSLARAAIPEPAEHEVVVEVQATPINPSDLGMLLGPADLATAKAAGRGPEAQITAQVPRERLYTVAERLDLPMPVGNEGAGVVVRAGGSSEAQGLMGRTVAMLGGAMYAQHRRIKAADCLVLPPGASAADGASSFINPLTALGMVETLRTEGHKALVHTASASNLGRMLNRICLADGIGLVNVVRSPAQVDALKAEGAVHVCDTSAASFDDDLLAALKATGATLAFDAVGGGRLASRILSAMEVMAAAAEPPGPYRRYGSSTHKQVYLYGTLDPRPTELARDYGMAWGVGGWLVTPFLQKAGPETVARLKARIVRELTTTFASRYTRTIALSDLLDLDTLAAIARRATGEKYLIDPRLG